MKDRVGQIRPSALLHTFGVGSLVDLPHLSVLIEGLDYWREEKASEIVEERALAAIRQRLGEQVSALRHPPWMAETGNPTEEWAYTGVPVSPFPRWLRCPWCDHLGVIGDGLFRFRPNLYRPDRAAYVHSNCTKKGKPPEALPVRFVLACEDAHLDDFPFPEYVHRGAVCAAPLLKMYETGLSAGPADVQVKCQTCGVTRAMADAFGETAKSSLPRCRGRHPHLGRFGPKRCNYQSRTLLLGASNAWFPALVTVLSIPSAGTPLDQLVDELWAHLDEIDSREVLDFALKRDPEVKRLADHDADAVWAAIEQRRGGVAHPELGADADPDDALDLLSPEWQQFSHPDGAPSGPDFELREADAPEQNASFVEKVVLAERLREVMALWGFSRITSPGDGADVTIAKLAREKSTWVPAAEVRGEGVFVQFREDVVAEWEKRVEGSDRLQRLRQAHGAWRGRRGIPHPQAGFPGGRYVLLHTLAHALIREVSLECGYSAASIRERIYATREGSDPMAGILLYTSAPDSEGTLGGLVSLGEPDRLGPLLEQTFRHAALCTSDPMCAEHLAGGDEEEHLHNAACHACLFVSETSCERGNRYLDRGLLVDVFGATESIGFTAGVGERI